MVLRVLVVVIILTGAFQPWWSGVSGALAQQPPPEKLDLTVAPPVLLADGTTESVLYVQLIGSTGLPALAPQDVEVSLVSSDGRIVRVPGRVVISAGESHAVAPLTTTLVPGKATITAVSRGGASATAAVETVSALEATRPFRLALVAAPLTMLTGGQPPGRLSIVLLGDNERSVPAPDGLEVVLSSSDPDVVRVAERVTVPQGAHFVTTELEALAVGSATLSAASSGFVSQFVEVKVVGLVGAPEETPPVRLALAAAPLTMLPGGQPTGKLSIVLLDDNGRSVPAPDTISLVLSSSDPDVVRVAERVTVPKGAHFVTIDLEALAVGSATLSAARSGFISQFVEVRVVEPGEGAEALALFLSPPVLHSGQGDLQGLILQAVDGEGIPVTFPCTQVHLASSAPLSVEVAPVAEVACGRDAQYITGTLTPGDVPGTSTITALAPGLRPATVTVAVEGLPPVRVQAEEPAEALVLFLSPPVLRLGQGSQPGLIVQAVDTEGVPVYFPCTQVNLASSAPLSVQVAPVAEGACDRDAQYVTGVLTSGGVPGTSTITAVAPGLLPATATLVVEGRVPAQLVAYLAPKQLLGIEATPGFLVVQVLDGGGVPVASHDDIPIKVVGGDGTIADEVLIPRGRSFARLGLEGLKPGRQLQLWLVNPSLTSAQLAVQTHILPIRVEASTSEEPIFPGDQRQILVRVRSAGSPLPGAALIWTATSGTLSGFPAETDANGEARALFTAGDVGTSAVEVLTDKTGYEEAKATVTFSVVAPLETESPSPKVGGIPVFFFLLAIPIVLVAYLAFKLVPGFRRSRE